MNSFVDILAELKELHDKKGNDYDSVDMPYHNIRRSADFGIAPWLGALLRGNDKMGRLQTYATKGSLSNESVEDSLLDLATYSIIALVLFREEQHKKMYGKGGD